MIADEAERLANLLPVTTIKKSNGRTNISRDLVVCLFFFFYFYSSCYINIYFSI